MNFRRMEQLGYGAYGVIYRGLDEETGRECAIKVIDKTKLTAEDLLSIHSEVKIAMLLEHPHIMKIFNFTEDERYINIYMELYKNGDVLKYYVAGETPKVYYKGKIY